LAFWADGKLKRIEVDSGLQRILADAPDFRGGSWNQNGTIIFTTARGLLYSIPAAGGEASALLGLNRSRNEAGQFQPYFLPDGRHFLYMSASTSASKSGIYVGSMDSKDTRLVASENELVGYSAPGFLLFARDFKLFAQRFDTRKFELIGEPVSIARVTAASTSANGILVYSRLITSPVQIAWYSRDGKRQAPIGDPGGYTGMALSPDNTKLTVEKTNPETMNSELWLLDRSSGIFSRLISYPAWGSHWSSDNHQIVFGSNIKGPSDLYRKTIGEGEAELIFDSAEKKFAEDWSEDGSIIVIDLDGHTFYRLSLAGERRLQVLFRTPFGADEPHVSPDGRWIAYDSNESGRWEIYGASFPAFTGRRQVSIAGGGQPIWRKDGRELFYLSPGGTLMSVDVKASETLETSAPKALFQTPVIMNPRADQYCVTRDGQRFIVMEYLPDVSPISVVVNWPALLR
jgi:Tol biopolymer transport system component